MSNFMNKKINFLLICFTLFSIVKASTELTGKEVTGGEKKNRGKISFVVRPFRWRGLAIYL